MDGVRLCDTFWGTHACDLNQGHDGQHECWQNGEPPCSQYDRANQRARYWLDDEGKWSEWMHREEWR